MTLKIRCVPLLLYDVFWIFHRSLLSCYYSMFPANCVWVLNFFSIKAVRDISSSSSSLLGWFLFPNLGCNWEKQVISWTLISGFRLRKKGIPRAVGNKADGEPNKCVYKLCYSYASASSSSLRLSSHWTTDILRNVKFGCGVGLFHAFVVGPHLS
jgi:hypothetical protein